MGIARSALGWLTAKYGALALSLLAVMAFTRVLSDPTQTLGIFQTFEAMVAVIMLVVNSGVGGAMVKRVSEAEGPDRERYVGASITLVAGGLLLVTALVLAFAGRVDRYIGYGFGALLLLGLVWATAGRNFGGAVLQGTSRVGRSGVVEFVEMAVRVGVQLGLILLGYELLGLVGGAIVGSMLATAVAVKMVPIGVRRPSREHVEQVVSFAKYSALSGFAGKFYDNVDTFAIWFFLGEGMVAVYNLPFRLALALSTFTGAINASILPSISQQHADGDTEEVQRIFGEAMVFSTILAVPATAGVAVLAREIIVTLFTSEFAAGATVAIIVVALQIPNAFRSVFTGALNGIDRPERTLRANILLVVTNAVLDVALVPVMGIEGAAVASFAAITVCSIYLGVVFFREFGLGWTAFPFLPLAGQVFSAIVMAIVVFALKRSIREQQLLELAILIPVGVAVYFGVLLVVSPGTRERIGGIVDDFVPT